MNKTLVPARKLSQIRKACSKCSSEGLNNIDSNSSSGDEDSSGGDTSVLQKHSGLRIVLGLALIGLINAVLGGVAYYVTTLKGVWGIGIDSLQDLFNFHLTGTANGGSSLQAGTSNGHATKALASSDHAGDSTYPFARLLGRQPDFQTSAVFFLTKSVCFVLCTATGGPGGLLMPSLIIGGFFGGMVISLFERILDPTLYAALWQPSLIFGVIGLFSANFRFPLTSVVILFELTGFDPGTWTIALPCILCSYLSISACDGFYNFPPLFEGLCAQDGISLYAMRWVGFFVPHT